MDLGSLTECWEGVPRCVHLPASNDRKKVDGTSTGPFRRDFRGRVGAAFVLRQELVIDRR